MAGDEENGRNMELRRLRKQQSVVDPTDRQHWTNVYHSMDKNGDGRVSYDELKRKLKEINANSPKDSARFMLQAGDKNVDGFLDLEEFLDALQSREVRSLFQNVVGKYVSSVVVPRKGVDVTDSDYEEEYSCCPPPLGMIIISILEIIAFVYDAAVNVDSKGLVFSEVTAALIYDPHKRAEAWRFLTYMFVHNGVFHLIVNLLVQIMLGIPLEMVHGWWRVILVYLAGVVAGSLGTSISDPEVYLAGASGGVYAVMTAHVATIIMNWSEMKFAIAQLAIFIVIASVDVGTAVYNRYIVNSADSQTIGYVAHLAGATAGLLVGINVLRNLDVKEWEKKLWWAAIVIYTLLMLIAIVWNIAFPSYFPVQTV